ncbi:MAG: hypothetical protein QXU99_00930 [Candidatus Bathyarchaeia archaeon]
MQQEKTPKRLLLPYVSSPTPTNNSFSIDIERAIIFCLAELDRDKGGGFFKKRPAEKLSFVSEIYYPFWVISFGDLTLLFDGLNFASQTLQYSVLPNINNFRKNLKANSGTREAYIAFLSDNINYFENPTAEQTRVINGLLTDADFLKEFLPYLREAVMVKTPIVDSVLISPANDEATMIKIIKTLQELRAQFEIELKDLSDLIKLLNLKTQDFITAIHEEISQTEKKFAKPIEKATTLLESIIAKINLEYTEKVTEISKKFEQEILETQKEIITLEKTKEQINTELEQCQTEIRTAIINKDPIAEQKWKEKRNGLKKEIPEIKRKTKLLTEKLNEIEENKKRALLQLRSECDSKIKEATKDLTTIKASRDAEIALLNKEMEKLEELTEHIIKQIGQLIKIREATLTELDSLGIKQKNPNLTLFYMPFYLIRYQRGTTARYTFYAPSTISNTGISTKLSAIGKMKIRKLLQPRFKKINTLLHNLARNIEENITFGTEINEACRKTNLLSTEHLQQSITSGLTKLHENGWLSDSEHKYFSQTRK